MKSAVWAQILAPSPEKAPTIRSSGPRTVLGFPVPVTIGTGFGPLHGRERRHRRESAQLPCNPWRPTSTTSMPMIKSPVSLDY
jgi:hypothetical protein